MNYKLPKNPTLFQRYLLLKHASSRQYLQTYLLKQCKHNVHFWFNWFAFTFDPRLPQARRPFVLYPFQETLLDAVLESLETGSDLLLEKSRDMGASWLLALTLLHQWLFVPGAQFLLGSRKLDLVDNRGDLSSLMEKLRFALNHLPPWMLPEGFSVQRHAPLARLINPATGAAIVGEASTAEFARGGRYKAILLDEFAFWPDAEAAFASAGQSSPCRLVVSTPYGKNNAFASLRFGGQIAVHTLHWQVHPGKTAAWYARQSARMSEDERARELDIHYTLSIKNRVYREFGLHHKASEALAFNPLTFNPCRKLLRVWDFGYHTPAVLWLQVDDAGRLLLLKECVGECEALKPFALKVLQQTQECFPGAEVDDLCDPAGLQTHHQSGETSITQLNRLGVYPSYERTPLAEGVEKVRHLLLEERDGLPALLVNPKTCPVTVEAFEGGYRYRPNTPELILEEHPYEDVMDCLRYAVWSRVSLLRPLEQRYQRNLLRQQAKNRRKKF